MHKTASEAFKRFNYLSAEIGAAYHDMSYRLGLSDSAMILLYTLCDAGGRRLLQEICRRCGLSKQTVNSALRKLEREGIIYLEPVDAKSKRVCLTREGEALAEQTAGQIIRMENELFAAWPQEDVQRYLALTGRFLSDIRKKAEGLRPGCTG